MSACATCEQEVGAVTEVESAAVDVDGHVFGRRALLYATVAASTAAATATAATATVTASVSVDATCGVYVISVLKAQHIHLSGSVASVIVGSTHTTYIGVHWGQRTDGIALVYQQQHEQHAARNQHGQAQEPVGQ